MAILDSHVDSETIQSRFKAMKTSNNHVLKAVTETTGLDVFGPK